MGWARSGVKGPLMWGSSSDRLISMIWSYSAPSSARRLSLKLSASPAAADRLYTAPPRPAAHRPFPIGTLMQPPHSTAAGGQDSAGAGPGSCWRAHTQCGTPVRSGWDLASVHGGRRFPAPPGGLPGQRRAPRGAQVVVHAVVVGEHGRGGADLGAHVADGAHACQPRPRHITESGGFTWRPQQPCRLLTGGTLQQHSGAAQREDAWSGRGGGIGRHLCRRWRRRQGRSTR